MKRIPLLLTALRIVCAPALWFCGVHTAAFAALYTLCGVSDALDGFAARRLHCVSDAGARLDSAADLIFYAAALSRILPAFCASLPAWVWGVAALALAVRLASYAVAAVKYRRFAALHTWLNKATGLSVFLLFYAFRRFPAAPAAAVVASLAVFSSAEELFIHLTSQNYCPERKSILAPANDIQKGS